MRLSINIKYFRGGSFGVIVDGCLSIHAIPTTEPDMGFGQLS
jgi:hypothetical protein